MDPIAENFKYCWLKNQERIQKLSKNKNIHSQGNATKKNKRAQRLNKNKFYCEKLEEF